MQDWSSQHQLLHSAVFGNASTNIGSAGLFMNTEKVKNNCIGLTPSCSHDTIYMPSLSDQSHLDGMERTSPPQHTGNTQVSFKYLSRLEDMSQLHDGTNVSMETCAPQTLPSFSSTLESAAQVHRTHRTMQNRVLRRTNSESQLVGLPPAAIFPNTMATTNGTQIMTELTETLPSHVQSNPTPLDTNLAMNAISTTSQHYHPYRPKKKSVSTLSVKTMNLPTTNQGLETSTNNMIHLQMMQLPQLQSHFFPIMGTTARAAEPVQIDNNMYNNELYHREQLAQFMGTFLPNSPVDQQQHATNMGLNGQLSKVMDTGKELMNMTNHLPPMEPMEASASAVAAAALLVRSANEYLCLNNNNEKSLENNHISGPSNKKKGAAKMNHAENPMMHVMGALPETLGYSGPRQHQRIQNDLAAIENHLASMKMNPSFMGPHDMSMLSLVPNPIHLAPNPQQQQQHNVKTANVVMPIEQNHPDALPNNNAQQTSSTTGGESKGRKYECTICQKQFTRPSTLRTHMNSHTGERPFACTAPGCGWRFTVLSNLRRHMRVCPAMKKEQTMSTTESMSDGMSTMMNGHMYIPSTNPVDFNNLSTTTTLHNDHATDKIMTTAANLLLQSTMMNHPNVPHE